MLIRGALDPLALTLFQVPNEDTGDVKFINYSEVKEIVSTFE